MLCQHTSDIIGRTGGPFDGSSSISYRLTGVTKSGSILVTIFPRKWRSPGNNYVSNFLTSYGGQRGCLLEPAKFLIQVYWCYKVSRHFVTSLSSLKSGGGVETGLIVKG